MFQPASAGKGSYGYKGKGKGKGKGECWNCGETGHRAYECKNATKKGKGKAYGEDSWQQGKWNSGAHSICGLKEAKKKIDDEGFKAASSSTAAVQDRRLGLQVSGGAFERLQNEDEDDEEEEVQGFQSQASIYTEKKQKQEEHAK